MTGEYWTLSAICDSTMPYPKHVMLMSGYQPICPANVFGAGQFEVRQTMFRDQRDGIYNAVWAAFKAKGSTLTREEAAGAIASLRLSRALEA